MEHLDVQRVRPPVAVRVSAVPPVNGHLPALLSSVFASMFLSDLFGFSRSVYQGSSILEK